MKITFTLLLLLHGLIHTMGFITAFQLAKFDQLTHQISKPVGLLWSLTTILFLFAAIAYILGKEFWPIAALIAVVISQLLIIFFWKDAKFGTLANIIILIASITSYGHFQFKNRVQAEVSEIFETQVHKEVKSGANKSIEDLPPIIQKWIETSGISSRPRITTVRLKQKGEMKTKLNGNWMLFTAEQYFNIPDPAFLWSTKVNVMPLIYMDGRDKLKNGKGEMLIKLLSLFPVVNEGNNEKIDSGSMQRYLAEMCWFPSMATENYISWEVLGINVAKATLTLTGKKVSGIFTFSEEGDFVSFETLRYFGGGPKAELETWFIEATDYKSFEGIRIPNKCKVTWKLKEGDFNWLNLEVTDLDYNRIENW